MSATTSSKDGPLKNRPSAHPKSLFSQHVCAAFLALVSVSTPTAAAQSAEAKSTSLHSFVGTYKEQSSEKRVRVVEKDGRLVYESADGLTLALFHLVQAGPSNIFQIEESPTHEPVEFVCDNAANVSALK